MPHDVARLILRLLFGGLMLFHGIAKLSGVGGIAGKLVEHGLPGMLAYGVYLGEIVAPVLLILGVATRTAACLMAFTMIMAIYLMHPGDVFSVGSHGEYALELQAMYLFGPIAIALLGPGRLAVPTRGRLAKL